jgi:hypothetical protein
VWCASSGPVCCVWGVSVLASARGLVTGVDAGAAALELSALSVVPSWSEVSSARVSVTLTPMCSVGLYGLRWFPL